MSVGRLATNTITGARASGFQKLALDTGALIEGLYEKLENVTDFETLMNIIEAEIISENGLGMTRGGNEFVTDAEQRQIEFDGSRLRFVGDFVKDTVHPRISTSLIEFSEENIRRIIPSSITEVNGFRTSITERIRVDAGDYMKSLSWVRNRSDGSIQIITLFNALNTESVTIPGDDKNEAAMAVSFAAFVDDFQERGVAPYVIEFFHPEQGYNPED